MRCWPNFSISDLPILVTEGPRIVAPVLNRVVTDLLLPLPVQPVRTRPGGIDPLCLPAWPCSSPGLTCSTDPASFWQQCVSSNPTSFACSPSFSYLYGPAFLVFLIRPGQFHLPVRLSLLLRLTLVDLLLIGLGPPHLLSQENWLNVAGFLLWLALLQGAFRLLWSGIVTLLDNPLGTLLTSILVVRFLAVTHIVLLVLDPHCRVFSLLFSEGPDRVEAVTSIPGFVGEE